MAEQQTPEQKKQDFKKLQEDKKELINELLAINQMLDTYRTNLNILIYNIYSNQKLKALPSFDFSTVKQVAQQLGSFLIGAKNQYEQKNFNLKKDEK